MRSCPGSRCRARSSTTTTARASEAYYDKNGFQVRPAALGDMQPHNYQVTYLGLNGDGHFGRWNVTASLYGAFGTVSHDPLAQQKVNVEAAYAVAEVSRDFDWIRVRGTGLFQSGRFQSVRRQGDRLRRDPRESADRRRRHELLDPAGGPADRRRRRRAVRPQRRAGGAALVEGRGPGELHESRASRSSASAPTSTSTPRWRADRQRQPALVREHVVALGAAQSGDDQPQRSAPTSRSRSSTDRCSRRTSSSTRRRRCSCPGRG